MSGGVFARNHVTVLGDGPRTVVLGHGFGSDQTAWRHQVEAFRVDHRVVLFDHVGAGRADPEAYSPRRYRGLHAYATDLLEILAELGAPEVDYVGHSMSGMIGLLAAREEPSRFRRMAFVGASPRYIDDGGYTGGFTQADVDGLYQAMETSYHAWAGGFAQAVMGNPERPELGREFAATLSQIRPDIALSVARIIFQSDHRADLAAHAIPTLVVQSMDDVAVPLAVGDYLAAHMPGARLARVEARGHLPHLSAPDEVTRLLRDHLA